jgi:ABC-2 type transport system permease protein
MSNTLAIARRELQAYFYSPVAYVILAVFLAAAAGLYFFFIGGGFFVMGRASMRGFFMLAPWLFMVFGPAITMRLIAEERKSGTLEVLMTLPVTEWEVVVGKFLGAMSMVGVGLLFTLPIPFVVSGLAAEGFTFDWGPVIGGYAGMILLASSFIALGMFASALTKNQIQGFLYGIVITLFLVWILDMVAYAAPAWMAGFVQAISVTWRFENISRGVIDSRDVLFMLSLTVIGLKATAVALRAARQ